MKGLSLLGALIVLGLPLPAQEPRSAGGQKVLGIGGLFFRARGPAALARWYGEASGGCAHTIQLRRAALAARSWTDRFRSIPRHHGLFRRARPRVDGQLPGTGSCRHSPAATGQRDRGGRDRKSTRLNSSHSQISYAVFCLKKKKNKKNIMNNM